MDIKEARNRRKTEEELRLSLKDLRKRNRKLQLRGRIISFMFILVCIVAGGCIYQQKTELESAEQNKQDVVSDLNLEAGNLESKLSEATKKNMLLYQELEQLGDDYDNLADMLCNISAITLDLNKEVKASNKIVKNYKKQLDKLEKNKKLLSSYGWALYNEDRKKTDISFDNIINLQELVKKRGLDEDTVDLILSICMTESDGNTNCTNPESTARGLGQFLNGTGRMVYTQLMGHSGYNHDIAFDAQTNLDMMVYFLEYLNKKENGDIHAVIDRYRGLKSSSYKAKINSYLLKNNKSLASINIK